MQTYKRFLKFQVAKWKGIERRKKNKIIHKTVTSSIQYVAYAMESNRSRWPKQIESNTKRSDIESNASESWHRKSGIKSERRDKMLSDAHFGQFVDARSICFFFFFFLCQTKQTHITSKTDSIDVCIYICVCQLFIPILI